MAIPQSLKDAINEEPDRFVNYLDIDKIVNSKNPYYEYLKQFARVFGQKGGLNLWQYVVKRYKLLNQLYKNNIIQTSLPKQFKGNLKQRDVKIFFNNYERQRAKEQKYKEKKIKKPIKVSQYIRKGKLVNSYNKTIISGYNERQKRFILSRKNIPIKRLTLEFNKTFNTSKTYYAIRDKKLRILGKKK